MSTDQEMKEQSELAASKPRVSAGVEALRPMRAEAKEKAEKILQRIKSTPAMQAVVLPKK